MKQTVGNACGTVGLLHAVGNITSEIKLRKFIFSLPIIDERCFKYGTSFNVKVILSEDESR